MLEKLVRRLGLGSPEAPIIPGMEVLDWRINELESGSTVAALCHKDSRLCVVRYKQRCPDERQIDYIDLTTVFPSYKAQFALYHQGHPDDKGTVAVKRTQVLDLVAAARDPSGARELDPGIIIEHEASICDRLMSEPHPNIVHFLGVQVNDELVFNHGKGKILVPLAKTSVTGLVVKKYDCTLDELVIRGHKVDIKLCLKSIAAALKHLHKMGYVHGCLGPHHIFVNRGTDGNHFFLGNFAGAHGNGDVITWKTGENQWSKRKTCGVDHAEEADDWYAFRKLTGWLIRETDEKIEDFADIEAMTRH